MPLEEVKELYKRVEGALTKGVEALGKAEAGVTRVSARLTGMELSMDQFEDGIVSPAGERKAVEAKVTGDMKFGDTKKGDNERSGDDSSTSSTGSDEGDTSDGTASTPR